MDEAVRVLIIDDSKRDAQLIERALRMEWEDLFVTRVDSADSLVAALEKAEWSAVLCDFQMPGFSIPAAMKILKERGLDLPFLVVSGVIGMVDAVALMKAGAHDFIDKGDLSRLVPALRRELEDAKTRRERKCAMKALRESESEIRLVTDSVPVSITYIDSEKRLRFANRLAQKWFARPASEILGKKIKTFLNSYSYEQTRPQREAALSGKAAVYEGMLPYPDGVMRHVRKQYVPRFGSGDEVLGFYIVVEDITSRKQAEEQQRRSVEKLSKALIDSINAMARTIEARDPYTAGHQERVAGLAVAIAKELHLDEQRIEGLRLAGLIHDIGKINIPAEILNRPGRLRDVEMELIRTHSQTGYDIVKEIEFPWPITTTILQHHERMDGSGYPQGLSDRDILLEARILGVADVVEAMSSHRPYRPARGTDAALVELLTHRGKLYGPDIVDACVHLFRDEGFTLPFSNRTPKW